MLYIKVNRQGMDGTATPTVQNMLGIKQQHCLHDAHISGQECCNHCSSPTNPKQHKLGQAQRIPTSS
ncbi:hypothetical protein EON63_17345 [archaeon]|nr:MAG: hypothetical protein EON63_17345 [archaeon]